MLRNARTNVLIHRRHAFNFLKLLNLIGLHSLGKSVAKVPPQQPKNGMNDQ